MSLPYLSHYRVVPNLHAHLTSGYRYHADFQFEMRGIGYTTIIGSLAWNTDRKLIPGSTQVETKITEAGFAVFRAGLGWNKLEELSGSEDAWIRFSNTVVQFKKRFVLVVPVTPVLSEVPIVKEFDITKSWPCEMEGYYDIITGKSDAKLTVL